MSDPDDALLLVNGREFAGWLSVSVTTAIDAASSAFSLSYTERWPGSAESWEILPGDTCELLLSNRTVLRGYVDVVSPDFDARSHTLSVQGRDLTGDLVDCSADHQPDEWKNLTLIKLADILCKPFGIMVSTDVDVGAPIPVAKIQQGETVISALGRFCAERRLLLTPDGSGGLLITRAGVNRAVTPLVQGTNILGAGGRLDWSQRFSHYRVKAQAPYSPDSDGASEAHIEGEASDETITRYRPLVIMAETASTPASAAERAEWEASVRIGQGTEATIVVAGWRQVPGGDLWQPNLIVPVRSPFLKIDGDMLIREVEFTKDLQTGTKTRISVVSPLAYTVRAPKLKKPKKAGGNPWLSALSEARP